MIAAESPLTVDILALIIHCSGAPGEVVVSLNAGWVRGGVVDEGEDTTLLLHWSKIIGSAPTVTVFNMIIIWTRA